MEAEAVRGGFGDEMSDGWKSDGGAEGVDLGLDLVLESLRGGSFEFCGGRVFLEEFEKSFAFVWFGGFGNEENGGIWKAFGFEEVCNFGSEFGFASVPGIAKKDHSVISQKGDGFEGAQNGFGGIEIVSPKFLEVVVAMF